MAPYTMPVITEPYHDSPGWLDKPRTQKHFVTLTSLSNEEDVELFLTLLLGYNRIDAELSFEAAFDTLFLEDGIAISGGIAFFENEQIYILPSCCCGLEGIFEMYENVVNKQSPWLGHDPDPWIEYKENNTLVWSDSAGSMERMITIPYSHEELVQCIQKSMSDLMAFIDIPLYQWLSNRNPRVGDEMRKRMKYWLGFADM
ncbi:hypothetical protein DVH26_27760 [Paenibacillus sp. H1-7]|uniref:hypothetical protein n=1 Tax=Paenibacillus sp. H1-7 TaxID=2282849 RepID=UPI001EF98A95|nr:hypothetical protein [Paenibacillus sp. H1-7]ULL17926.1 hypothetical protein DVH26_27760 [Paenibacillus sp. H1-7]